MEDQFFYSYKDVYDHPERAYSLSRGKKITEAVNLCVGKFVDILFLLPSDGIFILIFTKCNSLKEKSFLLFSYYTDRLITNIFNSVYLCLR